MKTTKIFSIIALIAAASMAFVSCEDDMNKNFKPAQVGDNIVFGGTSGYETEGRTVYGDKMNGVTEVKWYEGDVVRIYCDEARDVEGNNFCDYVVSEGFIAAPGDDVTGGENPKNDKLESTHSAKLVVNNEEPYGLQWGSDEEHKFFGVYPSPDMFVEGSEIHEKLELQRNDNGATLKGFLPDTQKPSRYTDPENGNYTIHPAMRFAYMVASAKAKHEDMTAETGVSLKFKPIVTAVQITLVNKFQDNSVPRDYLEDVSMVTISSVDGSKIAGNFEATLTTNTDGTINAVTTKTADSGYSSVRIPVQGKDGYPIKLAQGKSITFTAFLLPNTDLKNLKVSLTYGSSVKSTTITANNNGILVNCQKINYVRGLDFDLNIEREVSNWMSMLDDNTKLVDLSIPGAGGAASNYITEDTHKEQTIDIATQWTRGIRCFEIQAENGNSGSQIVCNNKDCGSQTINSVMTTIQTQIKSTANTTYTNGTECAFVILTYNHNGDIDDDRDSGGFQDKINSYINSWNNSSSNNTSKIISYDANTKLSDARGKIIMFVRAGSIGVDYGWHGLKTANTNALYPIGWGFNPDQWYARGFGDLQNYFKSQHDYTALPTSYSNSSVNALTAARPFIASTTAIDSSSYGYTYKKGTSTTMGYYTNGTTNITSNFGYYMVQDATLYGGLRSKPGNQGVWDGHNAWIQEWKRVAQNDFSYTGKAWNNYNYWWKGSADEKWDDVVETFQMSMNRGKEMYGNANNYTYYINSLCGYFISNNIEQSYRPTLNIQRYSEGERDIHPDGKYQSSVTYTGQKLLNNLFEVGEYRLVSINTKESHWGPYHAVAGYAGDIASFAAWINPKFYNYIKGLNLTGPTGIILMDRIAEELSANPTEDEKAGYYLPQIIIDNNFDRNVGGN